MTLRQWFFYYGNGTKERSIGVIDLPCVIGGQNMQIKMHVVPGEVPRLLSKGWLKENGAVLNTSSEELLLTKRQITTPMSEGPSGHFELDLCSRKKDFGEGRTGTLRPSSVLNRDQDLRVSPNTPGDLLESHDPEMLSLPAEQCPVIDEPRTLLRKRQVKQLLSTTEHILEVRAITSGSDISLASFSDSCGDLTEVAGRHGIEIADQVSCAAGWNPLSSSGRHRFWHIHCTLTPKLIIYRLPVAVQQWLSIPNPSDLSLQPRFRSARDQLRLYLSGMRWQHTQKRYFLLDTSMIPGSWTLVTLQALLEGPIERSKHDVQSDTLNMSRGGISSNAPCIMSCLRPLTQKTPSSSTVVVRSLAKPVKFWTAVMRGLLAQSEMSESQSSDLVSVLASVPECIRRMHTNLAHASVPDMQRMLLAARAPQPILDALKRFSCAQCDAMIAPKIPRGVSVPQTVAPLKYEAMDVKWLPSWEEDVRVKSVNIVDEASNWQDIYPVFVTETSEVLLRQYRQWTRAYGRHHWLKVDASRTNLGETLQRALEADGTQLLDIPGEAHEQVGRVEVHGRYFEDMLTRVLAQIHPSSRSEWLECVHQTMEAKNSLTRRCGFSPFQIAIGRDPELPGDLLQDLPNVISSSSILHDDVAAHTAQPVFDPMRDLQ